MQLAHTYSAVLVDPENGALGVGVQSHWFNVGRIVPWVRGGVGAVATQSVAEPRYGPRGLDLMEWGMGAPAALERLLAKDEEREVRQVAFADASGAVATHTGTRCIRFASHVVGEGWSVQANIMRDERVVAAMAETIEHAEGGVADRLMATLAAAERAGGDLRGSQSAALLVAGSGPVPDIDLRVEDHPDPIGELLRLLDVHRVYEHMNQGDDALAAGDGTAAAALYRAAAAGPSDDPEITFWHALTMASLGHEEEANRIFAEARAANPDLAELLRRLPETGLVEESVAASLLGEAG